MSPPQPSIERISAPRLLLSLPRVLIPDLTVLSSFFSLNYWTRFHNLTLTFFFSTDVCLEREVFGSLMEQLMINTGENELEVSLFEVSVLCIPSQVVFQICLSM